ncbi:MAG: hypothetical protein J6Y97_10995 [Prevotella sp.]|nr:hypothetical protein [Prevotella sp.]
MRKVLLFGVLLTMSLSASATSQEGDFIIIDGTQWEILGRPIKAEAERYNKMLALLPEERDIRSSNWEGYIAFWSIKQDALCLDSIQYSITNKDTQKKLVKCVNAEGLNRVYRNYLDGQNIVATWYTGKLHVAKGKVLHELNDGYERNYENEQFIDINQGKKTGQTAYDNKLAVEGLNLSNVKDFSELKQKFQLDLAKYPGLSNARRIIFSIKDAKVDAKGNLLDCNVTAYVMYAAESRSTGANKGREEHPGIAGEMKKLLKAYHPWEVYLINGEYIAYGAANRTFPYLVKDKQ